MTRRKSAPKTAHRIDHWLADSLDMDAKRNLKRMSEAEDVYRIAIMPDVHVSGKVCVGGVVATSQTLYPEMIGSDLGCGIAAIALGVESSSIDEAVAMAILGGLRKAVPALRQPADQIEPMPRELVATELSAPNLESIKRRDAVVQLGTLGRGNHFLELQSDEDDQLWMMVHSGSRGIGQAIAQHHASEAPNRSRSFLSIEANSVEGIAFLHDMHWAMEYARFNRLRMVQATTQLLESVGLSVNSDPSTFVDINHNHVRLEAHSEVPLWVHRKGAQSARSGEIGLIPGSMGTTSFVVTGRGCEASLTSSSHGAGRTMRRKTASQRISKKDFESQIGHVWIDKSRIGSLIDEAPAAYKNIEAVMRAQKKLVRIERRLRPLLNYKC